MSEQQLLSEYSKYANSLSNEEPDFGTQLNETITRSITAVILEKHHGKDAALNVLNNTDRPGGYKNKKEIYYLIKNKYISNRDKYKTFRDFVPVIFEYLKAYSLKQPFDIGPVDDK